MTDIVYGFVHHTFSLNAMQLRAYFKIHSMKEEGAYLHVNQAHNKYRYVQDKAAKKYNLVVLRNKTFYNEVVVDQWGLISVGLFVIISTDLDTCKN